MKQTKQTTWNGDEIVYFHDTIKATPVGTGAMVLLPRSLLGKMVYVEYHKDKQKEMKK